MRRTLISTGIEQLLNRKVKDHLTEEEGDRLSYIFICTTLWHETDEEVATLIKSLIRLISHARRKRDEYEFEINIFFDNAFEQRDSSNDPKKYYRTILVYGRKYVRCWRC